MHKAKYDLIKSQFNPGINHLSLEFLLLHPFMSNLKVDPWEKRFILSQNQSRAYPVPIPAYLANLRIEPLVEKETRK